MAIERPVEKQSRALTWALREGIVRSPVGVCLDRANTFTRVFRETEGEPWVVRKALALKRHLENVPLFLRDGDLIAGSIAAEPGAMPVFPEFGIGENRIYTNEYPHRKGYLEGRVPQELYDYWDDINVQGRLQALHQESGRESPRIRDDWATCSSPAHLSPTYTELLTVGLNGMVKKVDGRLEACADTDGRDLLRAVRLSLEGVSAWAARYAEILESGAASEERRNVAAICRRVAHAPPSTFHEAAQLIWFVHQAIHIEGNGYSCTADRLDQLLYPYYQRDMEAGRLDDTLADRLCENIVLKMKDNTVWGPEHNLTQGLCLSGSDLDGNDQTNALSWRFLHACDLLQLPEPLVWLRWHPNLDRAFYEACLENLAGSTCFPLIMNDEAVVAGLVRVGVSRVDAQDYVPAGCNEIAVPGKLYFRSRAGCGYLPALQRAMNNGRMFNDPDDRPVGMPCDSNGHDTFEKLLDAVRSYIRSGVKGSYEHGLLLDQAHRVRGQMPLTSCFMSDCVEQATDMMTRTRYDIPAAGGGFMSNLVDCLAAIRKTVYRDRSCSLAELVCACRDNFEGHEILRARLRNAPKYGNDDEDVDDLVRVVCGMRDDAVEEFCIDKRSGRAFGSVHIIRNSHIFGGRHTPALPDGRLAGAPLANSIGPALGADHMGPTALLNSVAKVEMPTSFSLGYNLNIRLEPRLLLDSNNRKKAAAMLDAFFHNGGQEIQINSVDSETLKRARENPDDYRNLVVRVAGYSEFFVNLNADTQEELIARTEHS